ncbi:MAG: hypothetical protein ACREJM_09350, partial [Candidatus Saccharimonadales bacterium]
IVSGAAALDTWSENGLSLLRMEKHADGTEFTIYHADGTLWYVLTERSWYYSNMPSTVDEYAADGKRKIRQITLQGGGTPFYVDKVTETLEDGTTWVHMYKSWSWDLSLVQHWDKDHKTLLEWKATDPNFQLDKQILTEPKYFDPSDEWTKLVDKLIYQTSAP